MFFNRTVLPSLGEIMLNDQLVPYHIRVSARRKNFAIEVHAEGKVVVCVPEGYPSWRIHQRLKQAADWILKKQTQFQKRATEKPVYQFTDDEPHFYLGKSYPLKITQAARARAFFQDEMIFLSARNTDALSIKKTLYRFYHVQALSVFQEVLNSCFPEFALRGYEKPVFRVRFMRSQWGSLSPKNVMTLNTHLVRMPKYLIEYVVMHELCHLAYRNHGVRFYGLLATMMPDWKDREVHLKAFPL